MSETFNVARLKRGSGHFEIAVDPDLAIEYKEKGKGELRDILLSQNIFSDAKKGLLAAESELEKAFDTTDQDKIASIIIKEGEIQLTTEYREKKRQEKRELIVAIIAREAVDPKTQLPHPKTRIENAFQEARVRIDEKKRAEDQVKDIVKQLAPILPIRFVTKEIAIKIPAGYAAKSYPVVTAFGTILKEEWLSDGSWAVVIEIPGGMENNLYDKMNSLTHGDVETKLLKTK